MRNGQVALADNGCVTYVCINEGHIRDTRRTNHTHRMRHNQVALANHGCVTCVCIYEGHVQDACVCVCVCVCCVAAR
jgi:hypothetical protein